jgi:hypothetical protein
VTWATRSPAGVRRSAVMAAVTTAIPRRSMIPITRRIAVRPAQQVPQWRSRRRPCRPGHPEVRPERTAAPPRCPAAGKLTRLPRGELEHAGAPYDPTGRDRNGARQRGKPHLDRCQRDTQREHGHSARGPYKEASRGHQCRQPGQTHPAGYANGPAIAPQRWHQGWQHHRHHHHDPHDEERRCRAPPGLPAHRRPRHRHRPAAGHRHLPIAAMEPHQKCTRLARPARFEVVTSSAVADPGASILIVPPYPRHREFEACLVTALRREIEVVVSTIEHIDTPSVA